MRMSSKVLLVALASVLASACARDDAQNGSLEGGRAAAVSDEAHGGTKGFVWLPPMVRYAAAPGNSGALDPDVAVSVRVDQIDPATGAVLATVATFTRESGLAINDDGNAYLVDWVTSRFPLTVPSFYRVRVVLPAPAELGFADVALVATGKDARAVDESAYVPLVAGTTLTIKFFVAQGVACSNVVCQAADQCHGAGVCDPTTGACSNPVVPDGTACTDGNACTTSDTCQAGACAPGEAVVCAEGDQCHGAGVCDPGTGACSNPVAPDGTACSDGDSCTANDTCQAGACTSGAFTATVVDDGAALCVPAGTTYALAGDRCYSEQVAIQGTLQVQAFDGTAGGAVALRAPVIAVAAGGAIVGDAAGYPGGLPHASVNLGGHPGSGLGLACGGGPGTCVGQAGSGAGYAGAGGTPYAQNPWRSPCDRCDGATIPHCFGAAGAAYGTLDGADVDMGSGGSAAGNSCGCSNAGGRGGQGGASISLLADKLTIDGNVSANGETPPPDTSPCGYKGGGGGGAGGGILVRASQLLGAGTLSARGGAGAFSPGVGSWAWAGGGGSGGRVKVFAADTSAFAGTVDVAAGAGGKTSCSFYAYCYDGEPGAVGSSFFGPILPVELPGLACAE